ncbi:polysaccharide deacetylase family protein [Fibrobacterota bacterium]
MQHRTDILFLTVLLGGIQLGTGISLAASGDTEICRAKGNRQAAIVQVSDDGFYESVTVFDSLWKEFDLKGTVALTVGWVEDIGITPSDPPNVGRYHGTWAEWAARIEEGHLDVQNHTYTHPNLPSVDDSPDSLELQINYAKELIDANIPNYYTIALMGPFSSVGEPAIAKAAERHYAVRTGSDGFNSLEATDDELLHSRRKVLTSGTAVAVANGWVDQAINEGTWFNELFHGQGEEGWEPLSMSFCEQHWSYIASRSDEIWSATFGELVRYIIERREAALDVLFARETEIQLTLTDGMPDSIFNYPLTLKTEVPGTWASVLVVQDTIQQTVVPVQESGASFAYYDAIPDRGEISLFDAASVSVSLRLKREPKRYSPVLILINNPGEFPSLNLLGQRSLPQKMSSGASIRIIDGK